MKVSGQLVTGKAALRRSLHIDAVHADATQHNGAAPFRQAVDDLLGEADAFAVDGIGILRRT